MRYTIPLKVRRFVTVTDAPEERLQFLPYDEDGHPEPCWIYSKTNNAGYGQQKLNGLTWNTHRLVWWILSRKHDELTKIAKPGEAREEEIILDHLCERRQCCNPCHLDPISQSENVKRGARWR